MNQRSEFKQEISPMRHPTIMINNHLIQEQVDPGVFIMGDTHGFFKVFHELKKLAPVNRNIPMIFIHVGDFGYWPGHMDSYPKDFPWPIYFIEGNHEYYPWIRTHREEITEVRNNLFYVPRGTTMEINGKTFGFIGGAFSPDKMQRKEEIDWWRDEEVTDNDIQKLMDKKIDVLVTHTPPANVILRNFGPLNISYWDLPVGTVDYSALRIEKLWGALGQPQMFCGHMHRIVQDGNCRILDINEVIRWEPL